MKKLLLIIDMQEGFRSCESEQIIPAIQEIKKEFDGEIIFTQFIDIKDSLFETQLQWNIFQDPKNQQIFPELYQWETIIQHHGYTIFWEELQIYIQSEQIEAVYLAGIYTDVCITKTAMDIFDFWTKVYIYAHCCASLHGELQHISALTSLKYIIWSEHII